MGLPEQAVRLGKVWPATIGQPWEYFAKRGIMLDCRGPLEIHEGSWWGYGVKVITRSHNIGAGPGQWGGTISRGVYVENGAWIGSYSLLVGCRIGAGSVVAAGTVVRCQDVAPGVMVAGNPARVIARWDGAAKKWMYCPEESGFERRLA
jgi:acetyltransferase-like isoleucine patch superfamily enzyme